MPRRESRREPAQLELSPATAEAMRLELPAVAERTVSAIIEEVPSCTAPPMVSPIGPLSASA